jgi:hypothetical protein
VLLCFNDGDLVEDSIRYLLEQNHQLVVWDHGSTDETWSVLQSFRNEMRELRYVPRDVDFYTLYPAMSAHLLTNYVQDYDWISWPDQDEFLEGPSRKKTYLDWLEEVHGSEYNWIQFNNYNFWYTATDDSSIRSVPQRVRHYSLFPDCAPRIRSWRASATNTRFFNHNPPEGKQWPTNFNLRHYPSRSSEQLMRRVMHDRAGLRRGDANFHYDNMKARLAALEINPAELHYDDQISELNPEPIFNWRKVYGYATDIVPGS